MNLRFFDSYPTWVICFVLMAAMLAMALLGIMVRPKRSYASLGALEGSLFGLLGLLLAFTFSMSASRYDTRREVIVEEANDIGTAVLRADMYVDSERVAFRKDFNGYLEARIAYHDAALDTVKRRTANDDAARYAALLWKRSTALSRNPANLSASNQMVPALNAMFDIATTRDAALNAQIPASIIILLFIISICCSFFVGMSFSKDQRTNWPMIIGFCLLTMCVVYTIIDLDRPYRGLIRGDKNEKYIRSLRGMLQSP
jgi:hypothetical protein